MSGTIVLSGTQFSVAETDSFVSISFDRTGDLSQPVVVEYQITIDENDPRSAEEADVQTGTGFATIPAGATSITIDVPVYDDALDEGTESFYVSIIGVDSGTLLFPRTARIDILDDENPEEVPADPPLVSDYDVTETPIYSGIAQPIAFEFSPETPTHMFVAQKNGLITLFDTATDSVIGEVLDLRDVVNNTNDRGLLDIALHPDLENNPYLYAFYVVDPPETQGNTGNAGPDGQGNRFSHLVRYTLDETSGYTSVVENSGTVILGAGGQSLSDISGGGELNYTSSTHINERDSEIDPATGDYKTDYVKVDSLSHAGGSIAFGPDGALYVSTGDGTSYNIADPRSRSVQDVDSLAGKILRLDPITGAGLGDNPFADQAGGDMDANVAKVYQLGLRNPYSMGFDDDGQLFITNTGWTKFESVFTGGPGANFGWPWFEGILDGEIQPAPGYGSFAEAQDFYDDVANGLITITAPYAALSHNAADPGFQVQAITGADDVIDSPRLPDSLQGHFIFTDVVQGEVFSINTDDRRDIQFLYRSDSAYAPVHFKQGPDGYVYYADLVGGAIGRLDITENPDTGPFQLGNSRYVRGTDGQSRAEAEAQALALGGTLLRVDSQAEQDFIIANFWDDRAIYLDASDAASEGVWVDGDGAPLGYTNWLPGEPNNGGGTQDHAVIARADGMWDDQNADQSSALLPAGWTDTVAMTIIEIPTAPLFTSADSFFLPENTTAVGTLSAFDPEGDTLSFAISGGADQALFTVDADSGLVSFANAPDFEAPADANGDNTYELEVEVTDGNGGRATDLLTIAVTDEIEGGVPPFSISGRYFEDQNGNDLEDAGEPGVAGALVRLVQGRTLIDSTVTGADGRYIFTGLENRYYKVEFQLPEGADFVAGNVGGDETVDSDVWRLTDDGFGRSTSVRIVDGAAVTDVDAGATGIGGPIENDPPVITSPAAVTIDENTTAVQTATADDPNGDSFIWTFAGGADDDHFVLNSNTGALAFDTPPDFETPGDADGDNVYEVALEVSDGRGGTDMQTVSVTVADVDETDPPTPDAPSISGRFFSDLNGNAIEDAGDVPVVGATVHLARGTTIVASTTTDDTGAYAFTGLGTFWYSVQFVAPDGADFVAGNAGSDDTVDSDVWRLTADGYGRASAIRIVDETTVVTDVSAGLDGWLV